MSSQAASLVPESEAALASDGPGAATPAEPVRAAPVLPSLRTRALHGSAWTTFDYACAKALSLVSNLILTRWLDPHEKGLMDLCMVVLTGLQMFSDIGIGPNIIFSKRGDQPSFLNTAWTIQVIRGSGLFVFSCLLAWPAAWFYDEPRLIHLLPVCGFTACILGFQSTSLIMLNRQMRLAAITVLDLIAQAVSIGVMVAWAMWRQEVWALVAGAYVSVILRVVYSHLLVREHKTRFEWNKDDARSMFQFGRWIFMSTVLTFFAMNLDRLLFAYRLGVAANAVYSNAVMFASLPQQLIKKIGAQVAFPVLAEVARERPHEMAEQFRRVRFPLVVCSLAIVVTLIVIAVPMIDVLYEGQWQAAGPMLRILAIGAMGGLINVTYGSALMALKKTFLIMLLVSTHIVFLIVASTIGYRLHPNPEIGFIWGVSMVEWLNYPVYAAVAARQGLWQPRLDIIAIVVSGSVTALVFLL